MEATSREAAPAKSSASGPNAPPALFELCGRAVSAHMGVLESGVWGKSRGEGLPLAKSEGGPAAGGRGGRGREARGKAQPGALEARSWDPRMNFVTDRAGQRRRPNGQTNPHRGLAWGCGGRGHQARSGAKQAGPWRLRQDWRAGAVGRELTLGWAGLGSLGCRTGRQQWPGCSGAGAEVVRPCLRPGGQARGHRT
ncbi:hypothetical protein P7K49_016181 [Saguinus oedipus]|uniref:Uncharacterized protein n=1 Tax=Saguinus oedipus TaxID=9490 RepID=A0ABQ9VBE2_SAGOE|nr:hypothetical protein P7K49_016181 [Saguinus oedipus]